ncbi:MAG: hypothetical protein JNM24_16015 [Bdellovibrionaceae bacterium]|nr:hypothetical protein [Pseudobdellovibrionaceae bacterium]
MIFIAFAANCVYFLVACQPKKGTSSSEAHGPVVAPVPDMPDSKGTSDQGGGGNLINGKPLDFYKKEITELPEYTKYIKPIDEKLNDIREDNQADNGVTYLETLAKRKTWYLVPVKLDGIEAARIGTNFKSDQGAYQTEKEIFISDLIYKDLDEEHKAQLLLHEIVMAFYLVKYEDGKFYCEAFKKANVRESCLSGFADTGSKDEFKPAQKKGKFLEADEYESIRHVTEWLYTQYKNLTMLKFEEKMVEKKFDPRVFNARNVIDRQKNEPTELSIKDFLKILETQRLTNQSLTYCGFDFSSKIAISKRRCDITYAIDGEILNMSVQTDDGKTETIPLRLPYQMRNVKDEPSPIFNVAKVGFKNGLVLYDIRLSEHVDSKHGQVVRNVLFWMKKITSTEYTIAAIRIKKNVWVRDGDNDNSLRGENVVIPPAEDTFNLIYGDKETDISIYDLM